MKHRTKGLVIQLREEVQTVRYLKELRQIGAREADTVHKHTPRTRQPLDKDTGRLELVAGEIRESLRTPHSPSLEVTGEASWGLLVMACTPGYGQSVLLEGVYHPSNSFSR